MWNPLIKKISLGETGVCAAFAEKHSRGTWATQEPRSSNRDAAFILILKGLNDALQVAGSQHHCTPHRTPPPACLPLCPASLGDEQLLRVRSGSVNNAAGVAPGVFFFFVPLRLITSLFPAARERTWDWVSCQAQCSESGWWGRRRGAGPCASSPTLGLASMASCTKHLTPLLDCVHLKGFSGGGGYVSWILNLISVKA